MPSTITILTADMTCLNKLSGGGGVSSVVIKAAVGNGTPPRCRNLPDDVRTVQNALNRFVPLDGGPNPALVPDGIFGPKTRKAIYHFQEKWELKPKGWKVPDGIVDPNGPTIQRLRKGSGSIPNLPAEFLVRIPRVIGVVTAARAALHLARVFIQRGSSPSGQALPSLPLIGQAEATKVDRHFHVNKTANPLARLGQIDTTFLNMQTAIGYVPQGVVLAVNEPPEHAAGSFMFTFPGGYHLRGMNDTSEEGLAKGSIYLCPKSRTLGPDGFAYGMIHELAHFTGPTGPQGPRGKDINDFAYFHKDPEGYRRLPPDLALRNADCYSQFAFDTIGKPDFNGTLNRS